MCSCDYAYYIVHKYHGHYQKKSIMVLLALLARLYSFRFSILLMHLYFTSMLRSGMSCWSLQCLHSWTSTIIYLSERKMNWLWEIVHVNCVYCHSDWIRGVAASIPCIGCCPHHTVPCQPLSYDYKSRFMHILRPVAKLASRWMAFCCRCRTSFWMPLGYLFPKLSPRFCTFLESLHNRPEVLQPPISARIARFCKFCIGWAVVPEGG